MKLYTIDTSALSDLALPQRGRLRHLLLDRVKSGNVVVLATFPLLAEQERERRGERTKAGLARVRAHGRGPCPLWGGHGAPLARNSFAPGREPAQGLVSGGAENQVRTER